MAKTGRPRNFDKNEAVTQAMHLFWERGYEATSLAELKIAMGDLSTASFYAAFGSKEGLFREVLKQYLNSYGQTTKSLHDGVTPPREAIELALRRSAKMQTDPGHPQGCFLVLVAGACAPENLSICEMLAKERAFNRAGIIACVERALMMGELKPTNPLILAAIFDAFLLGISTQARDGVPFETIDGAISHLMVIWDSLKK